ncbi:MAG: hypothetical protein LUH19_06810 [Lachnospiraceae bacterium]|nr:hypothetical protein [Lachnospiraceae bacterium]
MIWILDAVLFGCVLAGCLCFVGWMDERGIREIRLYSDEFLMNEEKAVRCRVLPDPASRKLTDRLELALYYSGIRGRYPFVSVKFWVLFQCFAALWVWILVSAGRGFWPALLCAGLTPVCFAAFLSLMRTRRYKGTEGHLLEAINLAEGFSATEEDPVAILGHCGEYIKGPVGQALRRIDALREQGLSSRMILEQLKLELEHPKWQEFIHNLNVCSMYNCDFVYVLQSSRKSTQRYLTSAKEKQSVKRVAKMEMMLIIVLSMVILVAMTELMEVSLVWLLWGSLPGKACSVYMAGILVLFVWSLSGYR